MLLVIVLAIAALACGAPAASDPGPSETSSTAPSATSSVFVATAIPTPRTTPPGTPGPYPTAAIAQSANIKTPAPDPNARPTPSPDHQLWRIEGYVVDDGGKPLEAVCVVVGPVGCQSWSPKTDERGYWFIDVAVGHTLFDFYFTMPGHKTVWWRAIPERPMTFNVILPNG